MQSLLQCSILSPELLSRASFVLRTCFAPLPTWAGLVKRARQLCAPESQSSELKRGDPESACSASTAVRVASENLALKLELFKQQKSSASTFHRKGVQRGTSTGNISNPCKSNLTHRLTVHIIGAASSAPLLQEYRDSLRAQGIEHVDPPMEGSCLVTATHVATIVYAPFIALGKSLSINAFDCAGKMYVCIMIAAGTENDHGLLLAQGLLSAEIWSTVKAACLYIDVIDTMPSKESFQASPCHDVILRFASDYDVIICDGALVLDG
jgi:hypothetical protein